MEESQIQIPRVKLGSQGLEAAEWRPLRDLNDEERFDRWVGNRREIR
ncbi:hypothetical protein CCACVL1_21664 [Corchorus capsularis]|uniref:Uncharacterized protein n=1 Tax=Corchorus capsularis TaxID=210143 RepID=A0A1R3H2M6_COCAP|nr:hypothetical protein CCACVL1_21664 [Corchorus capsularis]